MIHNQPLIYSEASLHFIAIRLLYKYYKTFHFDIHWKKIARQIPLLQLLCAFFLFCLIIQLLQDNNIPHKATHF